MLSVEIEFLTGRYSATAHFDRKEYEWPPHPARLFSALVATWADSDQPDPSERAALEWLESLDPPTISAARVFPRRSMTHFVPVNDAAVIGKSWYERKAAQVDELNQQFESALEESAGEVNSKVTRIQTKLERALNVDDQVDSLGNTNPNDAARLLPDGRNKQERVFPSVTLEDPHVTFTWETDVDPKTSETLDGILERVTRLGHSSSLVSCRVVSNHPNPAFVPGRGDHLIRTVRSGQLRTLENQYAQHKACRPRSLPFEGVYYGPPGTGTDSEQKLSPNLAGKWITFEFRLNSRWFPATESVLIARTMREAIFHYADDLPEGLTGHTESGSPSQHPHVSFIPLPYVGWEHADGRLMGVAVMIPDQCDPRTEISLLRAIGKWEQEANTLVLKLGRKGVVEIERKPATAITSLKRKFWEGPARSWTTVAPIALPAHPGGLSNGTSHSRSRAWDRATQGVADSCAHVGLPTPTDVALSLNPFVKGSRRASEYPTFKQSGRNGTEVARQLIHAQIEFDRPITGPLLLGSGRYFGLGLMRPISKENSDE